MDGFCSKIYFEKYDRTGYIGRMCVQVLCSFIAPVNQFKALREAKTPHGTRCRLPCIIVFVGTVGAGKSTQLNLLAFKLRTKALRVKTTSLKRGHLLTYVLEVALARLLIGRKKKVCSIRVIVEERPILFKKLFKLFLILDVVSIFCRFLFTIYLPRKLGYVIIVEEYIQAAMADYIALSEFVGFNNKSLSVTVNLLSRLAHLGGPIHTIFLDAPNDTLKARWIHRNSLSQRSDYLHMQRTLLLSISKKLSSSFFYINTNDKTIQKTGVIIMNFLKSIVT